MLILGLSSFVHDPAAALLRDGVVESAVEENKLLRAPARGLPERAIQFCLEQGGVGWRDLDAVVVATRPWRAWRRRLRMRLSQSVASPVAGAYYETRDSAELAGQLKQLRILRQRCGDSSKVLEMEHHLCHAASAFYPSPFERALVLTLDENGDGWSGLVASGEGSRLHPLRVMPFPHSLGWIYSQVTALLGFVSHAEEHKTQWLSLEGEPAYKQVFLDMFSRPGGGSLPRLNPAYFARGLKGSLAFSKKFYGAVGLDPAQRETLSEELRRSLASSLQHAFADLLVEVVEAQRLQHRLESLCLAGGVFQNPVLVAALEQRLGGQNIFVQPAAGNPGTALGAALLYCHQVQRQPRTAAPVSLYWGPRFTREDIKGVLDNCKLRYQYFATEAAKFESVVRLVEQGRIVAWYQGRVEFGPRALGNRSLLASPWAPYVRENLNDYVKHREWFRPFALAVPEEDAPRYFEFSPQARFMSSLGRLLNPDGLPAGFALPGGAVRLQVVSQSSNPLFWRLLKFFGRHAAAPILVNTSFNLFGEPLVVSPRDAVRSLYSSGIDALMIDNFLVAKQ